MFFFKEKGEIVKCHVIYCACAGGVAAVLNKSLNSNNCRGNLINSSHRLQESLAAHQITVKLNPPQRSPLWWRLGAWNALCEKTLQVVMGNQAVSKDVLLTLLIEVSSMQNHHFIWHSWPWLMLMGRRDTSLPQVTYDSNLLTKQRWHHYQMLADLFWSQFIHHYLPTPVRQKCKNPTENLAQDTVMMIVELPLAHWSVGRVVWLIASADGCIRSAEVKVKDRSTYAR